MSRFVVVGAGITGLTAAYRLAQQGADVTVVEADDHIGGKIRTSPFADAPAVEEGGDVFLARVPWATDLCTELGLGNDLISPSAASASVWWNGRMHPIPAGLVLGVPARLGGLAASRLLTPRGKIRAAIEPILPRHGAADSVGTLVRGRFGSQVLERLVDPLLGGINAGDADHLSLAASAPQLAAAASAHRSLLLGLRRNGPTTSGPIFFALRQGMSALPAALAAQLVDVRVSTPVRSISPNGSAWRVETDRETLNADGVVLAVPAFAASALLSDFSPDVAASLGTIPYASVAMITLSFPQSAFNVPLSGAGYLVPKPQQHGVTAVSFGSNKWPAWRVDDQVILRVSLGRYGNEQAAEGDTATLLDRAMAEIRTPLGLRSEQSHSRVTVWKKAFPQYLPGHLDRVAMLTSTLARDWPTLRLAGAAFDGIGIPACIRQGNQVARTMTQAS